jgi:hypothetical protein
MVYLELRVPCRSKAPFYTLRIDQDGDASMPFYQFATGGNEHGRLIWSLRLSSWQSPSAPRQGSAGRVPPRVVTSSIREIQHLAPRHIRTFTRSLHRHLSSQPHEAAQITVSTQSHVMIGPGSSSKEGNLLLLTAPPPALCSE